MRFKKYLMRMVGSLFILVGLLNLIGLTSPEVRDQLVSISAVTFRYSIYVIIGIGMLLLHKWSAYAYVIGIFISWALFFTVYEGESAFPVYISLIGPILVGALYYYSWPILKPASVEREGVNANA